MTDSIRVRFAPSPTGLLHLGSARTAFYNWLVARHAGADGTFVLRIEDTDTARSTEAAVAQALRVLTWLGLNWDEGPRVGGAYGPYVQSKRAAIYTQQAERLVAEGKLYPCYCTKEQLEADAQAQAAAGKPPIYEGRCRSLSSTQRAEHEAAGDVATLRFAVPETGTTVVDDMIHGETPFDNALLGDFIVVRGDGTPVYNFAAAVDDAAMQITHVIRGDDHLSNTPRQVLLYQALEHTPPKFAHVPMILGPDKRKLSKRSGAASVEEMAEAGYVAEGLLNYLALLGWSKDDSTTVMTTAEMVEYFDVSRVRRSPAAFDYEKLRWLNGQHFRTMDPALFASRYEEWCETWLGAEHAQYAAATAVDGAQAALLAQHKVETFADVPALVAFVREPYEMSQEAWEKLESAADVELVLATVHGALSKLASWDVAAIEQLLRGLCEQLERKARVVFGPVRLAVTGQRVSPGLFESIFVLGRERATARIAAAAQRFQQSARYAGGTK